MERSCGDVTSLFLPDENFVIHIKLLGTSNLQPELITQLYCTLHLNNIYDMSFIVLLE